MRKLFLFFFFTLVSFSSLAQEHFSEHSEITMAGDTLEFTRFSNKTILVYTAALWHDNALQYADLLRLQDTYRDFGFVLMEFYSADMSNIDFLERTPFYLYNRGEYPPCSFTFPLLVAHNHCPFFRFLIQNTTSEIFVTKNEDKRFAPSSLQQPLHKWIINREGRVVRCFDPTVPMTEVVEELKEVLSN